MLIDECVSETRREDVYRVASVLTQTLEATLTSMGVRPDSVGEAISLLREAGVPFLSDDIVDDVFRPRFDRSTPFRPGRFNDGNEATFYAALSIETAVSEKAHYVFLAGPAVNDGHYAILQCEFEGNSFNLTGKETTYPDLISDTGWSFCQTFATEAKARGIHAFVTPSARDKPNGLCSPIFVRATLRRSEISFQGKFAFRADQAVFERSA